MNKPIEQGAVVRVNRGGPNMLVVGFEPEGLVLCVYRDEWCGATGVRYGVFSHDAVSVVLPKWDPDR